MVANLTKIPIRLLYPLYERTSFHRSVTAEVEDQELRLAYEHCRQVTRTHAKTFYLATRFLPNKKQRGIFALYALCRYLDDLVDEAEDLLIDQKITPQQMQQQLCFWKEDMQRVFHGGHSDHPVLIAIRDTLNHFHIEAKYPFELLEGVCMDLHKNRFERFDELYRYSYLVASVVGLMTTDIFGFEGDKAKLHAEHLGIAMQLTNILRDIGEDLDRNRIYLPQEDLERFGVSEEQLFARRVDDNFRAFMAFQIARAREYYDSAAKGIPMLSADSRLPVAMAHINYSRILNQIEAMDYHVLDRRAYLSTSKKLGNLPRAWWMTQTA